MRLYLRLNMLTEIGTVSDSSREQVSMFGSSDRERSFIRCKSAKSSHVDDGTDDAAE